MEAKHREPFIQGLTLLATALDFELPLPRAELYWESLQRFPADAVKSALHRARDMKWYRFPQIGELIELIDGSHDDRAQIAWIGAWNAVAQHGPYRSIRCEDPMVAETIRRVFRSWADFCNLAAEGVEHNVKHREFLETYRVLAKRGGGLVSDYLSGIFETSNAENLAKMDHGMLRSEHPVGWIAVDGSVGTVYEPLPADLKPLVAAPSDAIALESTRGDEATQAPRALPASTETDEEKAARIQRLREEIVREARAEKNASTDDGLRAIRDIIEGEGPVHE